MHLSPVAINNAVRLELVETELSTMCPRSTKSLFAMQSNAVNQSVVERKQT